jgi:hypothetical protein
MANIEREPEIKPKLKIKAYYKGFEMTIKLPFKNPDDVAALISSLDNLGFVFANPKKMRKHDRVIEKIMSQHEPKKEDEIPVCAIHNQPMVQRQGQYGTFWACPVKEGGVWCKYRPPKK